MQYTLVCFAARMSDVLHGEFDAWAPNFCDGCERVPPFGGVRACKWNRSCFTNWCHMCIDEAKKVVNINGEPHCENCLCLYYGLFWRSSPFFIPFGNAQRGNAVEWHCDDKHPYYTADGH